MSYRDKTPQILSILTRKLKSGKSFEDFPKGLKYYYFSYFTKLT